MGYFEFAWIDRGKPRQSLSGYLIFYSRKELDIAHTEGYRSAGHRVEAFLGNCNPTSITLVTTSAALQMSAKKCYTRAAA